MLAAPFSEFVDPNPNPGNQFGAQIVALSTGNVVITSPFDDAGGTDAGAVYLFDGATGALISTLLGSTAGDLSGNRHVIALGNGNYVVRSDGWDNGSATDAGAVTFGNGITGVSGVVSAANSLVGSTAFDRVGNFDHFTVLSNGNYVVSSPRWNNGAVTDAGAVTFGNGTTGVSGVVSVTNSLVGSTANDQVGEFGVTLLNNDNYVVRSRLWDNGSTPNVGAVTFGNGTTGVTGVVNAANSLVGSTSNDQVGAVTALSNGNYVVSSGGWDNGSTPNVGAVTFGSGTTGVSGVVSAANSLVGSTAFDSVGGVTALSNGNYVVRSPFWDNGSATNAGAATFGSGTTGVSGVVNTDNSVIGLVANTGLQSVVVDDVNGTFFARFVNEGSGKVRVGSQIDGFAPSSVSISGLVFDDLDNDRAFEPGDGETGIGGVTVTLTGTDAQGAVNRTTVTLADGSYAFDDVFAGDYSLEADQPVGFLDGKETAGSLDGTVDNTQDSNTISDIAVTVGDPDATGYNFAEIQPSEVLGLVWQDVNNDGEVNFGEQAIEDVTINVDGTDDRGNTVSRSIPTDTNGIYVFVDLRPGDYTVSEVQPAGFNDGLDVVGTVNGVQVGDNSVNDTISGVVLALPGSVAENYNFGERPLAGGEVEPGQTAGIGYWQNNNGQALIAALNGGATSIQLGDWLAATFPNMYGANAGSNDLSGFTNTQVADFYSDLFRRKKKEAEQLGLAGPPKTDAQVLATALAVYVTNSTLAGTTAESYGFLVTENGVGTSTLNVGNNGDAFDVADGSEVSILDLLLATNDHSLNGVLYDEDGDGDADDGLETLLRTMANDVYSAINEQGDF